ncbi:MAG: SRPBCC family protein [Blastocatellia bacterium]
MIQWLNMTNLLGDKRRARNRARIDSGINSLGYLGLGAGLMYFFDPDRGRRRRALMRDRMAHTVNVLGAATSTTARDLSHRASGILAEGSHLFKRQDAPDEALEARVRSTLGRAVSHPHAIAVAVDRGHVTLSGPILANEMKGLLKRVSKIPGVRESSNELMAHKQAGDTPGLQGGKTRMGSRGLFAQTNWAPTARLIACATGGALMGYCLKRRDLASAALGTLGFGLFMRGLTNLESRRLVGIGAGASAVVAQKTININAPVGRVYEFFTNCQNFPRFMTNVREVRRTGNGHSRWTVAGPMGVPIKWAARITENTPNQRIAWETVPGSLVKNSGIIQFRPNNNGGTQVEIKFCYNPIVGAVGHALAKFFGADPKSEMDADLLRMKTMIETGHAPHDAANPLPLSQNLAQERISSNTGRASL